MSHIPALIQYMLIFRLAIVAAGVICVVLGYLLFVRGVFPRAADGNAQGQDLSGSALTARFQLRNAAPGTCFAVLGAFLIVAMVVKGSPEVLLKEANFDLQLRGDPPAATTAKAADADAVVLALATSASLFNDYAWMLYESGREAEKAELLAQLAVLSVPDNSNFKDTLMRIQQKRAANKP